jgi:hypothetical protein
MNARMAFDQRFHGTQGARQAPLDLAVIVRFAVQA